MQGHDIAVFAGPSLRASDRRQYPGIRFLPPVADGDIFRLAATMPDRIGIIDGYFGNRLSIFHKEILWAMANGITVFGASSMGALRAAELDAYGMIGIGGIFRAFRDGTLIEDDAVAVLHGPEELDFIPMTIAMVDVDATISAMAARNEVSKDQADRLLADARGIHFEDRTWAEIARRACPGGRDPGVFAQVLDRAHVQLKRLDALALLSVIVSGSSRENRPCPPPPGTPAFRAAADRAYRGIDAGQPANGYRLKPKTPA